MVYIYIYMVYIWYIYGIYGVYIMVYIYTYMYMARKYSRVKKVKNRKATKVNRRPNTYVISKGLKD